MPAIFIRVYRKQGMRGGERRVEDDRQKKTDFKCPRASFYTARVASDCIYFASDARRLSVHHEPRHFRWVIIIISSLPQPRAKPRGP